MSLAPLAQRRQLDLERDQAEIQIVAERAVGHALGQILMGGRNDAEIALHRPLRPDRQHLAVFQGPQQFHLHRPGDVGHFVEKNRAAVGLFQQSLARPSAPVNAPRTWPNNSLSASDGLSEATLTATNGPSARRL